jgi:hypothetical protein
MILTGDIIKIDLRLWVTQAQKAEDTGRKLTTISQQVKRSIDGKTPNPVEYLHIPALGITLVKRDY